MPENISLYKYFMLKKYMNFKNLIMQDWVFRLGIKLNNMLNLNILYSRFHNSKGASNFQMKEKKG